jgi:hypothetical protein
MTTNHIERLNEALIRPGRVDVRVRYENATPEQIEQVGRGTPKRNLKPHATPRGDTRPGRELRARPRGAPRAATAPAAPA